MREQSVRSAILARLVLLLVVVLLVPTLLNANVLSHMKLGKHKRPQSSKVTAAQAAGLARMRRMESLPGRNTREGDREGGPLAFAKEQIENRAYPGTDIPFVLSNRASQHFARVQAESEAGSRGPMNGASWTSNSRRSSGRGCPPPIRPVPERSADWPGSTARRECRCRDKRGFQFVPLRMPEGRPRGRLPWCCGQATIPCGAFAPVRPPARRSLWTIAGACAYRVSGERERWR